MFGDSQVVGAGRSSGDAVGSLRSARQAPTAVVFNPIDLPAFAVLEIVAAIPCIGDTGNLVAAGNTCLVPVVEVVVQVGVAEGIRRWLRGRKRQ